MRCRRRGRVTVKIEVEQHFCHAAASLDLPVGVTVITGRNGAGKSALAVESIALACFGKTVRGSAPGDNWLARVVGDSFTAERAKTRKGTTLKLEMGAATPTFETTTKAQEALEAHLGLDFASWRRTHLFSAAGLAQFSEATDAERKRLLEALLGLDKFDRALANARADLQAAKSRAAARASSLAVLRRVLDDADRDVADARQSLERAEQAQPTPRPPTFDMSDEKSYADTIEATRARRDRLLSERRRTTDALGRAESALQAGACSECGRPFEEVDTAALEAAVEEAAEVHKAAVAALREADAALQGLVAAQNEYAAARRDHEYAVREWEMGEKLRAVGLKACREQLAAAELRALQADRDLEDAELEEAVDANEVALLANVEKVLGLKGARAVVLEDALRALEAEANDCLAELAPGASVSIMVGASISIAVNGLGGARFYEEASAGERCRLDVALLLAIAAIAPRTELPLVFDDVFGTLDEDGIDAAARLLMRVGRSRRVVVITQLESLVSRMRGAAQVVSL